MYLHEGMINCGSVLPANPNLVYLLKRDGEGENSNFGCMYIDCDSPCAIINNSCGHTIARSHSYISVLSFTQKWLDIFLVATAHAQINVATPIKMDS